MIRVKTYDESTFQTSFHPIIKSMSLSFQKFMIGALSVLFYRITLGYFDLNYAFEITLAVSIAANIPLVILPTFF